MLKENLPNSLTIFRVLVIPFIILSLYANWAIPALMLYILATVTDFLDGHLARKWNVISPFGRFLDPIADKLLVLCVMIAIIDLRNLMAWEVAFMMLITFREIFISGLREFVGPKNITIHVSKQAKWKTTLQLVTLGLYIAASLPIGYDWWIILEIFDISAQITLIGATGLTLYTAWQYFKGVSDQGVFKS